MRIQVVFYSMYGHVYRMAEAVADGARQVPGAEVSMFQVPELTPADVLARSGADKARQARAAEAEASIRYDTYATIGARSGAETLACSSPAGAPRWGRGANPLEPDKRRADHDHAPDGGGTAAASAGAAELVPLDSGSLGRTQIGPRVAR